MTWLEFHNEFEKLYRDMTHKDEILDVKVMGCDGIELSKVKKFTTHDGKLVIEIDSDLSEGDDGGWRDQDGYEGCSC